ncbi:MAG: ABC transporter permease [bacterium]|nr:ABC transporter permease [bacterium]
METFWRDVRFSARSLAKAPGVTAVAVLSLALGIGANTTIFTLINAVFLNPLPVEDVSRLVAVYTVDENMTGQLAGLANVSHPNFEDFRDDSDVFSGLAAYSFPVNASVVLDREPEQLFAQVVSGNYFEVLGIHPAAGRFFYPREDVTPGLYPVAVIGHGLWQRRFAADPDVVGRSLSLNGFGFTIVGVAPDGFTGVNAIGGPEIWVPTMMYQQILPEQFRRFFDDRRALIMSTAGRLQPGATLEQAEAQLETIAKRLEQEYPEANNGRGVGIMPLAQATIFPGMRGFLVLGAAVLMAVVAMVLLIACSNVANLLIARAGTRRKEIAVRLSMGASRWSLVRQLLSESVLLGLGGGVLGLAVAYWGRDFIWSFRPIFVPQGMLDLALDGRVLAFTLIVALVTGALFGLVPALQASRPQVIGALKEETRGAAGNRRRITLRGFLVVAQVALSFVALVAAGLFLRGLGGAYDIDPGFETEKLAVVIASPGQNGYDQPRAEQFYRDVVERVGALPEVESVTLAANLPLFGGFARTVFMEGQDTSKADQGQVTQSNTVDLGYFETVGIPIVRGRGFSEIDREETTPVAIVNQFMADKYWPGEQPIGRRFRLYGEDHLFEVVGVARTARYITLGEDPQACFYLPLSQNYSDAMTVYVRSSGDAALALAAAEREIHELDPDVPRTFALTVGQVIDQSLWASKLGAALLAALGGLGLVLAAVGLYGVMAYSVSQRTREIGIRMAIGAAQADVLRLVVRQAMVLVGIGIGVGLLGSFAVSRVVAKLLYGVNPTDPATFLGVPLLLAAVALLASLLPALRASRVDPVLALHTE